MSKNKTNEGGKKLDKEKEKKMSILQILPYLTVQIFARKHLSNMSSFYGLWLIKSHSKHLVRELQPNEYIPL